ncbi:hypothetical protein X801_04983 [Opisthorchis viverrini]|uniref:Uncharacterized protein n=1 Tax=Opisthorchis viverrini TaxID=6198 RepID=A0A1S8WXR1_OPIVI|nr:hypothetical protein X801_04983 [Opisthorchis viverrini]
MCVETVEIEEETPRLVEDKQEDEFLGCSSEMSVLPDMALLVKQASSSTFLSTSEEKHVLTRLNGTVKIRQKKNHNQPSIKKTLFTRIIRIDLDKLLSRFRTSKQIRSGGKKERGIYCREYVQPILARCQFRLEQQNSWNFWEVLQMNRKQE